MPSDGSSRRLDRSQLPDEFTPETVRAMGLRTARMLARPGNGILSPGEQEAFDRALRATLKDSTDRLGQSFGRGGPRGGLPNLDPDLRRSYQRTQRRLDAQAARARQAFPQLTDTWAVDTADRPAADAEVAPPPDDPRRAEPETDSVDADDVSIGTFEAEIEQTSDMMEILEQIAGIQQQQLDHQRSQLLNETRGVFFALAVSVAVIVAGIAPLVEATPHQRGLILLWTAGVCAVAGAVYAAVRAVQMRSD